MIVALYARVSTLEKGMLPVVDEIKITKEKAHLTGSLASLAGVLCSGTG
jgi:hypothetical protein